MKKKHLVNWNISVAKGKKINRDSESSGERNWNRPESFNPEGSHYVQSIKKSNLLNSIEKIFCLENLAKEGDSPVNRKKR